MQQPVDRSSKGRRGWGFRLFALFASCVVALFVAEIGVRLFLPVTDFPLSQWDPAVGLRWAPNQSGRFIRGIVQGEYTFNAQGWNHPDDYQIQRPKGTIRVCLVGDSYVAAKAVRHQERMHAVAERIMNSPDRPAQWYPFGRSGFGFSQYYQVIRHYVLDYKPDVVIAFWVQNDPYDSSPYLLAKDSPDLTFVLDDEDQLTLLWHSEWQYPLLKRLMARSALARYIWFQSNLLNRGGGRTEVAQGTLKADGGTLAGRKAGNGLSVEEGYRETWRLIEAVLAATKQECERRGAIFAIVLRGDPKMIQSCQSGKPYEAVPREEDPYCLDERLHAMGADMVQPIADRLGIPCLDLTDAICRKVKETGQRHDFPMDAHYGPIGHQAAGEAMAEMVETLLRAKADGEPLEEAVSKKSTGTLP